MEQAFERLLPNGSLLDFFWSWRFLIRSLLAVVATPLPQARVFHAVATGFAGLVGSCAKIGWKRPLLVTEHGIYTNERRIDLAVADWLFDSGAGGFDVTARPVELRSIWLNAFQSFSRISYAVADVITTQYRANQAYQRDDGAPHDKLRIIPNGIDPVKFAPIPRDETTRPLRTVLMIGQYDPMSKRYVDEVRLRTDVFSARPNEAVVGVLLQNMRGPAGHSAHGEERSKQVDRHAAHVVSAGGIKVYIRVELLFRQDVLFDGPRHLEPLSVP